MRLIDPPDGRPWALLVLCGASLLLNVILLGTIVLEDDDAAVDQPAPAVDAAGPVADAAVADAAEPVADAAGAASPGPSGTLVVEDAEASADAAEVAEPVPEPTVVPEGVEVVRADVTHSLARTFQRNLPDDHADVVAAIYARLFFWDLDLRRDLQQGDQVAVAYEWNGELADIPVATYRSKKLDRTLHAYRFKIAGDQFPSWWNAEGREVGRRLEGGPLRDYEQVTSLLKDRPDHQGMDFKTPVGTEVIAPKAGSVLRTDWNTRYNGNCIELRYRDGVVARFLHLSATRVRPGQSVSADQVIGLSGNTGRSTAPHLHYELEKSGRVLDPVDYHGVVRRTVPATDRAVFEDEKQRLDRILASES